MSLSAVKAALDTVKPVETMDEISSLRSERLQVLTLQDKLLPFEAQAHEELAMKRATLDTRINTAETARRYESLAVLPNSVLSWTVRQKKAWRWIGLAMNPRVPAFAYIPVDHPECRLNAHWGSLEGVSKMPKFIRREYEKAMSDVCSWTGPNMTFRSLSLSYSYKGVVPDEIRTLIRKEQQEDRFDELGFICEVDRWEISGQKNPPPQLMDPIVVGIKNETIFVLGSFDPTPTEEYLLREFAA